MHTSSDAAQATAEAPGRVTPEGPPATSGGAEPVETGSARRVLRNAAFRSVGDMGSKLATLALFVITARSLGRAEYGTYVFAVSLVSLVTAPADVGQETTPAR